MASRRTGHSVWLWSIIVLQISSGAEAQLVLTLDMVPEKDVLCPGDMLQLHCRHNSTNVDPEWRIMNGTYDFRTIYFLGSNLEGHALTLSTNVLEVLQLGPVQHEFNGMRYLCLYDTHSGEKRSNEVTVNLQDAPEVRGLTAEMVDSTTANISWQQYVDDCNQTTTPHLFISNSSSVENVMPNCTQPPHIKCLIPDLVPNTRYMVVVYITTEDGRRSATKSVPLCEMCETGTSHSGPGEDALCTTDLERLECVLHGVTAFFVLALVVVVIIGILCIIRLHPRNPNTKNIDGEK